CEQVVVVPIEERELCLAPPQDWLEPPDEMEAGESASHHDDAPRHQFARPATCSTRASSWRYACVIGSSASSSLACARRSRAAFKLPARSCANPASAR